MNVFHKVTRESLRKNRLRTIVTIVGVFAFRRYGLCSDHHCGQLSGLLSGQRGI